MTPIIPGIISSSDGRQPDAITATPSATAGSTQATVTFTAPTFTGKPNTNNLYTVTSTPGGFTGTGTASPITVTGLTNGTAYTFKVKLSTRDSANTVIATSLDSPASNSVTPVAPYSFVPYSFTPYTFTPYTFTPVYTFTPYAFTPVFTFAPTYYFIPYAFTPVVIPWFGPPCVEENTLVDTVDGPIPAKFLKVGDKLKSYAIAELDYNSPEYQKYLWNSETFTTGDQFVETEITSMIASQESDLLCFNENFDIKITFTQPVFIKSAIDGTYKIKEAYYVEVGDSLIIVNLDGTHTEVPITHVDYLTDELVTVYEFSCEPYDWFFVGGVMVHNK